MTPPRAKKIPHQIQFQGEHWTDDWFWLREKENPEVIAHLHAENAYTESVLQPHKAVQDKLFAELKGRIKEDDSDVPTRIDDYYYYSRFEAGKQYPIYCRKHGGLDAAEEVVLDANVLAEGKTYFSLGAHEVSPDHSWIAYSVDFDGSEKYTLRFKNLRSGEHSPEEIPNTSPSLEWAEDNQTVFYAMLDQHERPDRLLRHRLGSPASSDVLIHQEKDPQLFVYCAKSRSRRYIFLHIQGKETSEQHFIEAHDPNAEFRLVEPRRRGVLYGIEHHDDAFYILTNDDEVNFRLVSAPVSSPGRGNWRELRRGHPTLYLENVDAFQNHLVLQERVRGLPQIRIIDLKDGNVSTLDGANEHTVAFDEPTYSLALHANPEFKTRTLRFTYSSLVTPSTVYDYDMTAQTREVKKVREVPGGYDPSLYQSEFIFAHAADGTEIPISLVYKKDLRRGDANPLYLYGYGAYGLASSPWFSTHRLSLLDRGFVYAIAHIRGGDELGRTWYEDGKFLKKKNTFTDFIASAEHLIRHGYTRKGEIVIAGGSAGGMLVGAVLNMRPDLVKCAIAHVPFVDVLNTMLDETLPLTTTEYEEWGNPADKTYFDYIKSYSPYENVKPQAYPHLLVTAGLNDPRVTYWEPAKWVQRLRDLKTDQNLILLHTHMEAGHGGASGRFDALKDYAQEYTFIFKIFNLLSE